MSYRHTIESIPGACSSSRNRKARLGFVLGVFAATLLARGDGNATTFLVADVTSCPSGTGFTCVSRSWNLDGPSPLAAQAYTLDLPQPDPSRWAPVSATITVAGPPSASFAGTFATGSLPPGCLQVQPCIIGGVDIGLFVADAGGASLLSGVVLVSPSALVNPSQPTQQFFDSNAGLFNPLTKSFGLGQLGWTSGPLRIGYSDDVTHLAAAPLESITDVHDFAGSVTVVYAAVPEPATGTLILSALSMLAVLRPRTRRSVLGRRPGTGCSRR